MKKPAPAIKVENVSKTFILPHEKVTSVKSLFINGFKRRKKSFEKQQALKDISFEVEPGEFFGIVGRNGSGKSTLLKMLAGIYTPTRGDIQVNGTLTPFIELGVGFNPELTGRENVFLNGALLGFNRKQMSKMYKDIVEFAELERFMDQKLKNYSSGMQVRLAFSIAIRAQSDILLIDEVLAVGDAVFQKKCYDYFKHLAKERRTVIFVSHDIAALQEYCSRGILIDDSKIVYEGKIEKVISKYIELLSAREDGQAEQQTKQRKTIEHVGTGDIVVKSCHVMSAENPLRKKIFYDDDNNLRVNVEYEVKKNIPEPIYGITIFDGAGERAFVTNNMWVPQKVEPAHKGEIVLVTWTLPNVFNSGTFTITPAVAGSAGTVVFDQVEDMINFKVRKRNISNAHVNVPHTMDVKVRKSS